jgi:hypothetical protein
MTKAKVELTQKQCQAVMEALVRLRDKSWKEGDYVNERVCNNALREVGHGYWKSFGRKARKVEIK